MKMKNKVLAVLALALLMINMVPVKRAEAEIQLPDLIAGTWTSGSYAEMVAAGDYVVYLFDGDMHWFIINSKPVNVFSSGYLKYDYIVTYQIGGDKKVYISGKTFAQNNSANFNVIRGNGITGSNYDYTGEGWDGPHSNVTFPWLLPPEIPDSEYDTYDRLGFIPQNVNATYLADGIWNITYNPSILEYYMWYSVRISTPHIYMVEDWDSMTDEQILDTTAIDNWRKGMTNYYDKTFDVLDVMPADNVQQFTTAGYFGLDVKTLLQERWSDLYPNIDISMLEYVCEYAYPQVVVTRSFYIDYGSRVFGPANITRLTKLYGRYSDVNQEDILWGGGIASDNVSAWLGSVGIQTGNKEEIDLNVALKEEIEQLKIERQTYLEQIAALESQIDNMVNGDSIFDTFSNIANGLKSMSGSVRSISMAVGNVFAFFPGEITTILLGGFVACIIIAVYKALRG